MDVFLTEWLNLLLRWGHIIVGIGWIGTSFYFIGLDVALRKRDGLPDGVYGSAWQVHGGGFYDVRKYAVAPPQLPPDLIWFKWEAYLTWVTGFALLVVQYYLNASAYLIDPNKVPMEGWQAAALSIASLALGWIVYDRLLCRSAIGKNTPVLAALTFLFILAMAWAYAQVFSGRGALIHVGAFIGTIMAFNVFMVIIPNQKKIVAALIEGRAPDPALGAMGKQRSVHNTYLTLPVLLMMVSNHYPMLTNHPHSWLLVGLIIIIGGSFRHLIVRHEAGDDMMKLAPVVPVTLVALVAALWLTAPRVDPALAGLQVSDTRVMEIVGKHCATCHAVKPTHESFTEAPKGVALETVADLRRYATLIDQQAVKADAMPLGNESQMSVDERRELGAWLAKQP